MDVTYTLKVCKTNSMNINDPIQSAEYWNALADNILPAVLNDLWRQYADYLNSELLKRFISQGTRFERTLKTDLFDESLGQGLIPFLSEISTNVTGIDIAFSTTLSAAKKHTAYLAVNSNAIAPPFAGNSFDLIISNSTFDHFATEKEIEMALGAMARILRPGGHLIWTMDNPRNPIVSLRNVLTSRFGTIGSLVPYQMGKTWNLRKMVKVTRSLGLDVQDTASIMHCPRVLAIQFLKYLKMLNKNASGKFTFKMLRAMEHMELLPTRSITAHYSGIHAVKKQSQPDEH